jgi:hypothetical protein
VISFYRDAMPFTEKILRAPGTVRIADRHIKRYHVNLDGSEIYPDMQAAAYAFLPELLPQPDGTPPATFTVLHQTGQGMFLNAYSWFWDNVIYCRTAAAGVTELGCPDDDTTHWTELDQPLIGCVWELPTIEHERSAWVRHMLAPEVPDLDGYLRDIFPEGPVGAPVPVIEKYSA